MSLVVDCDINTLGIEDIIKLVTAIDVDGNIYIRVFDDGTDPDTLDDLVECDSGNISVLDILRGALVTNLDGEFALNVTTLE